MNDIDATIYPATDEVPASRWFGVFLPESGSLLHLPSQIKTDLFPNCFVFKSWRSKYFPAELFHSKQMSIPWLRSSPISAAKAIASQSEAKKLGGTQMWRVKSKKKMKNWVASGQEHGEIRYAGWSVVS